MEAQLDPDLWRNQVLSTVDRRANSERLFPNPVPSMLKPDVSIVEDNYEGHLLQPNAVEDSVASCQDSPKPNISNLERGAITSTGAGKIAATTGHINLDNKSNRIAASASDPTVLDHENVFQARDKLKIQTNNEENKTIEKTSVTSPQASAIVETDPTKFFTKLKSRPENKLIFCSRGKGGSRDNATMKEVVPDKIRRERACQLVSRISSEKAYPEVSNIKTLMT